MLREQHILPNDRFISVSGAQEALAQLALELEEHSTDKVVVFAGYDGEDVSSGDNLDHETGYP